MTTQLALQPSASAASKQHFRDTIANPVEFQSINDLLAAERGVIEALEPEGIRLWGASPGSIRQWEKLQIGDLVVFVADRIGFYLAEVACVFDNPELGARLWGLDAQNRTWQYMYAVTNGRYVSIATSEINSAVGYSPDNNIQGFLVLTPEKSSVAVGLLNATNTTSAPAWVDHIPARRPRNIDISVESVQSAINRYREIGRDAFLAESGGNKAFRYVIAEGDLEMDAKAIVLAAHNAAHPDQPLRATDFDGNRLTVAEPLRQLGFYVDDLRAEPGQDAPLGPDPEKYIELASRLEGSLDTSRTSGQRREQSILRGALGLYRDATVQCGLCGKTYPSGFVVAGHIKKRSECTDAERLDVINVAMPICVFGCDALFEKRYIKVINGSIVVTNSGIADVDAYLDSLVGRRAPGWTSEREKYFAWHSEQPVLGTS